MKIRFGYIANAVNLWNGSPSKTLTFARYCALPKVERLEKLKLVTAENLHNTKRILYYNIALREGFQMNKPFTPRLVYFEPQELRWNIIEITK